MNLSNIYKKRKSKLE